MPIFVGELDGARVIQIGLGQTDATAASTTDVLFYAETQDEFPMGGGGHVLFTGLKVTLRHTNGFSIGVTPVVDGTPDTEQTFQVSSASVGTDGIFTAHAPFRLRGERCACRVRQIAATDVVELVDIALEFVPIRSVV
jgi:methyl coenzyme M reductase beta subunit